MKNQKPKMCKTKTRRGRPSSFSDQVTIVRRIVGRGAVKESVKYDDAPRQIE